MPGDNYEVLVIDDKRWDCDQAPEEHADFHRTWTENTCRGHGPFIKSYKWVLKEL